MQGQHWPGSQSDTYTVYAPVVGINCYPTLIEEG